MWFIDRHVFSELYVIYNFLYFPSTPQLFCHNSIICWEQNPTNYGSARAFGAFTAVRRSIKKDKRAWVIAQALLLKPSPPHTLVQGLVDGNQSQWQVYHPFQNPCHNLMMWLYPLLLCSMMHAYIFNITVLFIFGYFSSFNCDYLSNCLKSLCFSLIVTAVCKFLLVMVGKFPFETVAQYHPRAGSAWTDGQGSSQKLSLVLATWLSSFLCSTTDWTLLDNHGAEHIIKYIRHLVT